LSQNNLNYERSGREGTIPQEANALENQRT